jgi:hypothetical protein
VIALGVDLDDLIDDRYREWLVIDKQHAAEPPDPEALARR